MIQNSDNSGWVILGETTPNGVTSVTHTRMDNYDWIITEFSEVETSSASLVYIEIGYGGTPTYATCDFVRGMAVNTQFGAATPWWLDNTNRTDDHRGAWTIPNMARNFSTSGENMRIPVTGAGFSHISASVGSNCGVARTTKEPITAIRYTTTAGNLQGTGAEIRTWGRR